MFSRPLIAFDFGSSSVKVLELSGGSKPKVLKIGLETLPRDAIIEGRIENSEAVERVTKDLLKNLGITATGRRAAISVGGDNVLIKKIFMPYSSSEEMEDQIEAEAKQNFHADIDELYWQSVVLQELMNEHGEVPVLLVAADRAIVDQKIDIVHGLGLKLGLIDCEVFSLLNCMENSNGKSNTLEAVVNIGSSGALFALFFDGLQVYTRQINMGGDKYTNSLMDAFNVDFDNAEMMKIAVSNGDQSMPPEIFNIVNGVNEEFLSQIKSTVEDFRHIEREYEGFNIENVWLSGGGASIAGLNVSLATAMQTNVDYLNPFKNIKSQSKKNTNLVVQCPHIFSVSCGMAFRTINDHLEKAA